MTPLERARAMVLGDYEPMSAKEAAFLYGVLRNETAKHRRPQEERRHRHRGSCVCALAACGHRRRQHEPQNGRCRVCENCLGFL